MLLKKIGRIYSNGHWLFQFKLVTDMNKKENTIVNINIVKNAIGNSVKPVNCNKLNSLQEQKEYKIINMQNVKYRKKDRYIFKIENLDGYYISNCFFEKTLKDMPNYNIMFRNVKKITTPTNKKEMDVLIL